MEIKEALDLLQNFYGVKRKFIYEEMGLTQPTFLKHYKDNTFKECHVKLVKSKWGALLNELKVD